MVFCSWFDVVARFVTHGSDDCPRARIISDCPNGNSHGRNLDKRLDGRVGNSIVRPWPLSRLFMDDASLRELASCAAPHRFLPDHLTLLPQQFTDIDPPFLPLAKIWKDASEVSGMRRSTW